MGGREREIGISDYCSNRLVINLSQTPYMISFTKLSRYIRERKRERKRLTDRQTGRQPDKQTDRKENISSYVDEIFTG